VIKYTKRREHMNFTFFLSLLVCIALPFTHAYAFSTKGQDCRKCHTLKKEEASSLLQAFDINIKVISVKPSPAKGFWEVSFDGGAKKGIVYIDFPKKHIFSGSLFQIQGKKNLTQDSLSLLNKVDVSKIPLKDTLLVGSKSAQKKVIVFDDPE